IYPSLTVGSSYDTNVFATKDDTKDDFIFNFLPGFVVRSNFPRHAIVWSTQADIGRYVTETSEDYEDFGTALDGRLDITRNNRLTAGAAFARGHDSRDDPEDQGVDVSDEPSKYYTYGGDLGFQQEFNRFNVGLLGTFDRTDYTDGDEGDRDRDLFGGRLRTGYFISPRINAFLQGGFRREVRDQDTGRDNNVYSASVGTEIDFTGLLFGEVNAGWSLQEFDESDVDSENGFTYGANLTWNPTGLTSVRLDGAGGFEPSDVGSSRLESEIGLRVDHELRRNLLIGAQVRYSRDDFQDANRVDNRIDVGPDITYFVNRYLSVGADYVFTKRDSDDSDREFDRNVITLRVTAQL
ncbi:MAG: outer membrane beta-barrel protein, partial [Geminicoccaceae bacterium]